MKEKFPNRQYGKPSSGRLVVGLDTQMSAIAIKQLIVECGGIVESIHKPNVADVSCPSHEAQAVLSKLRARKGKGVRFADFDCH